MKQSFLIISILFVSQMFSQTTCGKDTSSSEGLISWNIGSPITMYDQSLGGIDHVLTLELLVTAISDEKTSNYITVFPNPVIDDLKISFINDITYSVFNTDGKLLSKGDTKNVSFKTMPVGAYTLKVLTDTGEYQYKIIKQ